MLCIVCQKEFEGRTDAKFCSPKCKMKHRRVTDNSENVTDNQLNVTNKSIIPNESVTTTPDGVSENTGFSQNKSDKSDYYHSKEYLDLVKHLEETPIKELEKEGIFIPCWKLSGKYSKRPNVAELLK